MSVYQTLSPVAIEKGSGYARLAPYQVCLTNYKKNWTNYLPNSLQMQVLTQLDKLT